MPKDIYLRQAISSLINVNKIVTIHYSDFDKNFDYEGESHDFWELLYVERGEVNLQTKNKQLLLKEGEIIFHKPNEFQRHFCNGKVSPRLFIVSFVCRSSAMAVFRGMHTRLPAAALPVLNRFIGEAKETFILPEYDPHIKGVKMAEHAPPGGPQMVKLNLEMLLIMLLRESERSVYTSKDAWERRLTSDITAYLSEHLYESVMLEDICKKTHYSKTLLCSTFKRVMGMGIIEYHSRMRIDRSKELLLNRGLTVSEASDEMGFENQYYFSRVFKRCEGKSPREFLKESRKN